MTTESFAERIGKDAYGAKPYQAKIRVRQSAENGAAKDCQEASSQLLYMREDPQFTLEDAILNTPWHTLYQDYDHDFLFERAWYDAQHQLGYSQMSEPPRELKDRALYARFASKLSVLYVETYRKHVPDAISKQIPQYEQADFHDVFRCYYNVPDAVDL